MTPSILQTDSGNAWLAPLPAGTHITPIDPQISAVAVNELLNGEVLNENDVYIVSRSYLRERNKSEADLNAIIEKLKLKYNLP